MSTEMLQPAIPPQPLTEITSLDELEAELPIPDFDPNIHLNYQPPTARHTFDELGLPVPKNIPNVCYIEPFQLLSDEGIRMMRRQIFRRSFLDKWMRSWDRSPCIINGYCNKKGEGNFIQQCWDHAATRAAVNHAFGHALSIVPAENAKGHINVQVGPEGIEGVYQTPEMPMKPFPVTNLESHHENMGHQFVDGWHKDMYPVVIVMMLSDTTTMTGGETAVKLGNGDTIKIRGAAAGGAMMMTGGHLEHAALRASNCAERISMVNGYNYADADLDDSATTMMNVNVKCEDMIEWLNIFMEIKVRRLRDRCDLALARIQDHRESREPLTRESVEPWVKEQIKLLKQFSWEMFERVPNYLFQDVPGDTMKDYLSDV